MKGAGSDRSRATFQVRKPVPDQALFERIQTALYYGVVMREHTLGSKRTISHCIDIEAVARICGQLADNERAMNDDERYIRAERIIQADRPTKQKRKGKAKS